MSALEIITRENIKDLSSGNKNLNLNFSGDKTPEYDYSRRCSECGSPYIINRMLPEEMIKILGDKIKYIPSCKCHETFYERKIKDLSLKSDRERLLNRGYKYRHFSAIDSKFLNSTFEKADFTENLSICKRYAQAFMIKDVRVGLILYGNSGTGKTFDSACIGNYLMERGKSVMALNLGLYLARLKSDWSRTETEILDKISECDLLIIDDFGAERITDWVLEKVFLLIDVRYKSEKPIIISTNLEYRKDRECDIARVFGKRVKDRINEMCYPLFFYGESRRKSSTEKFKNLFT